MHIKLLCLFGLLICLPAWAQEDTTAADDEFDFSQFELAAPAAKSFCNNKVLGQSPTPLLGVVYNFQGPHNFTAGNINPEIKPNSIAENNDIESMQGFSFVGNFPLISRNNILINLNVVYDEQYYNFSEPDAQHPLTRSLQDNPLRSTSTVFTVFKPLNETRFLLGQFGLSFNGDYNYSDFNQSANTIRYSAALLYGFKPSDRLMYAFGLSRTYLGGALNYVPVAYYYHTFKNQKWGVEALLPARALLRYRFNSTSLMSVGFNVIGNTYRLNNFGANSASVIEQDPSLGFLAAEDDIELRRSEIRAGLNYSRAISGFFWFSVEAGYRINYSYDVDRGGDFVRFFGSDEPYFIENELGNPLYFQLGISYMSP